MSWDEQCYLPSGAADLRAEQSAVFAALQHREFVRPEIGEMLSKLEAKTVEMSADERIVVRHARKEYDRERILPSDFVARRAETQSLAYHRWREARAASDFRLFAPWLQKIIDLAKEEAGFFGKSGDAAYDYWIDQRWAGLLCSAFEAKRERERERERDSSLLILHFLSRRHSTATPE